MKRARLRAVAAGALGAALAVAPLAAQEIVQAVVLDLTIVEVQVIVAAARSDDRLRCLVRAGESRVRAVAERPVGSGFSSGRTTLVSLPLPMLAGDEREFSVALIRGGDIIARTPWRPVSR